MTDREHDHDWRHDDDGEIWCQICGATPDDPDEVPRDGELTVKLRALDIAHELARINGGTLPVETARALGAAIKKWEAGTT